MALILSGTMWLPTWLRLAVRYRTLLFGILVFGILGSARGMDEGTVAITVTQDSFKTQFGLVEFSSKSLRQLANEKSTIVSMVILGSIAGSVVAMLIVDKIGRVSSLRVLLSLWILGVVIQITTFSHSYIQLLIGRLIAGVGIGMTTVVCPTYLVEVAPPRFRGMCSCVFSTCVYVGILVGYVSNWLTELKVLSSNRNQWVVPVSLQIAVAAICLVLSFGLVESPRWYCMSHQYEKALMALARLRCMPEDSEPVLNEFDMIAESLDKSRRALEKSGLIRSGSGTSKGVIKSLVERISRLFTETKYQMFLGIMVQLLSQWTGANAITMYAPEFFHLVDIYTHDQQLFMTTLLGVSKLVSALVCTLFLIDRLGRKRALYTGIALQLISTIYITIFLRLHYEAATTFATQNKMGFVAIAMLHINGAGWSMGWNSVQYLVGAELFPLHLRGAATGFIMLVHFVNQYANSKALPLMLLSMKQWGEMLLNSVVAFLGLIFVWFFIPEPSGKNLEDMQLVFSLPWYKVGRQSINTHK